MNSFQAPATLYCAWTSCVCTTPYLCAVAKMFKYPAGEHDCIVAIFTFCIFVHIELSTNVFKRLSFRLTHVSALHFKIKALWDPA